MMGIRYPLVFLMHMRWSQQGHKNFSDSSLKYMPCDTAASTTWLRLRVSLLINLRLRYRFRIPLSKGISI